MGREQCRCLTTFSFTAIDSTRGKDMRSHSNGNNNTERHIRGHGSKIVTRADCPLTGDNKLYLDQMVCDLKQESAALLVGSGFSKNAHEGFPDWKELADCFCKKLGKSDDRRAYVNPMRLASEVE